MMTEPYRGNTVSKRVRAMLLGKKGISGKSYKRSERLLIPTENRLPRILPKSSSAGSIPPPPPPDRDDYAEPWRHSWRGAPRDQRETPKVGQMREPLPDGGQTRGQRQRSHQINSQQIEAMRNGQMQQIGPQHSAQQKEERAYRISNPLYIHPGASLTTQGHLKGEMQLMLLEQQNKKRLLMARQEQDNMTGPQHQVRLGALGFQSAMSPQGNRPGSSLNPQDQLKGGTPKLGQISGSPLSRGPSPPPNMNFDPILAPPGMPPHFYPQMPHASPMMSPPDSYPGAGFNGQQMTLQELGEVVRNGRMQLDLGPQQQRRMPPPPPSAGATQRVRENLFDRKSREHQAEQEAQKDQEIDLENFDFDSFLPEDQRSQTSLENFDFDSFLPRNESKSTESTRMKHGHKQKSQQETTTNREGYDSLYSRTVYKSRQYTPPTASKFTNKVEKLRNPILTFKALAHVTSVSTSSIPNRQISYTISEDCTKFSTRHKLRALKGSNRRALIK